MYPQRESLPAVTAAGVVAILFASLGIVGCVLVTIALLAAPNLPHDPSTRAMPEATRAMVIGVYGFFFLVCVAELVVAINVLRRKNWARIAIIVWASIMAFFSAVLCIAVFFIFSFMPQTGQAPKDPNVLLFMKFFMLVLYGIPFAVALWWLILFTRPRVAAAFRVPVAAPLASWGSDASGFPAPYAQTAPPVLAAPKKPSCPIPLIIVCAFLLLSAFCTPFFLLVPQSAPTPTFFFGLIVFTPVGKFVLASITVILGALAIGVIRLKPPALDAIIAIQVLFLINGILSILSPSYLHSLHDSMQRNAMANPAFPNGFPFLTYNFLRDMMIGSVAFSSAVVGIFIGFRDRFRKAASEASA